MALKHLLVLGYLPSDLETDGPLEKTIEHIRNSSITKVTWIKKAAELEDLDISDVDIIYPCHSVASTEYDSFMKSVGRLPNLKYIHSRSTGVNGLAKFAELVALQKERDLVVTNGKGCYSASLAEWSLFAMAYFAKSQHLNISQKRSRDYSPYSVGMLRNAKVAIIGYGDIGMKTAKLCKEAYSMHVTAIKSTVKEGESLSYADEVLDSRESNLIKVFKESEFVVAALPYTPATHHLLSKRVLEAAGPRCVFINIGRGGNVDQSSLVAMLKEGECGPFGVALDVFEVEPIPESDPIWEVPDSKLLISPHTCDRTFDMGYLGDKRFMEVFDLISNGGLQASDNVCLSRGY